MPNEPVTIAELVRSPVFWFSAGLMGLVIGMIATYAVRLLDRITAHTFERVRRASQEASARDERIVRLIADDADYRAFQSELSLVYRFMGLLAVVVALSVGDNAFALRQHWLRNLSVASGAALLLLGGYVFFKGHTTSRLVLMAYARRMDSSRDDADIAGST